MLLGWVYVDQDNMTMGLNAEESIACGLISDIGDVLG